jgi:hypothetical protein
MRTLCSFVVIINELTAQMLSILYYSKISRHVGISANLNTAKFNFFPLFHRHWFPSVITHSPPCVQFFSGGGVRSMTTTMYG